MLQVKSIRKMNQHSFLCLLAVIIIQGEKGNTGLTLEQMLATTCRQILFHTGYDVYILVHLSLTYIETTCP